MLKRLIRPMKYAVMWLVSCFHWDPWKQDCWSQEGEDQILKRIFSGKKSGFYVDVGAHHPKRFSNTYLFYKSGWSGINIDAMPGSMKPFQRARPRDINLELGIGRARGELEYYVFNEPALNGFSASLSESRDAEDSAYAIKDVIKMPVVPLAAALENNLPPGQSIDFLSVDVEGLDLEVLQSNNWDRYRPAYVLVEILRSSLHDVFDCEAARFMQSVGYEIYAKSANTVIFRSKTLLL